LSAIEMDLIAAILDTGDMSPIFEGHFTEEHCLTNEGKALYQFIANYRVTTQGAGRIPTRATIEHRFDLEGFGLPEQGLVVPDVRALLHEVYIEWARKQLRELASETAEIAEDVDPLGELAALRQKLEVIETQLTPSEDGSFATHLDEIVEDYAAGALLPAGIPWPWPTMQEATNGLHRGEFYPIVGRPKARKTFVALEVCVNAMIKDHARVLVVTPEMPVKQMLLRATAFAAKLNYTDFKKGELSFEDEQLLAALAQRYAASATKEKGDVVFHAASGDEDEERDFAKASFVVTKGTNRGLSYIEAKVDQYKPDIVFIDSFYRLSGEGQKKSDADWKVVTSLSRGLKDMAMDRNVVVIGTHQMNRGADREIGSLANLALSDGVGQDADMVIRVITCKRIHTNDISALVILGARETSAEGVLINNVPCCDFSEIEPIISPRKIMDMLMEEEQQDVDEGEGEDKKNRHKKKKKQGSVGKTSSKAAPVGIGAGSNLGKKIKSGSLKRTAAAERFVPRPVRKPANE